MFGKKPVDRVCAVCGKKIVFLAAAELSDGLICTDCFYKSGINMKDAKNYSSTDIHNILDCMNIFNPDLFYPGVSFDTKNMMFKAESLMGRNNSIYMYENIMSYSLLENDTLVTRGGIGAAVVGGVLFNAPGAIVGSNVGRKKTKKKINSLKIKVTLRNAIVPAAYISIVENGIVNTTFNYGKAVALEQRLFEDPMDIAQNIMSVFENILDRNNTSVEEGITESQYEIEESGDSIREQIEYYKKMLDDDLITEEDFESVKKKILGI